MKKLIAAVISLLLVFSFASPAFAAQSSFGAYEHVFIIGIDGAGASFSKVDTPNFDRIFAGNAYTYNAVTEEKTISAQNWGSILTGVICDRHGLTNDNTAVKLPSRGTDDLEYNTIFYYARQAFSDARLTSICHWSNINHGIIENDVHVKKVSRLSDPLVEDSIIEQFQRGLVPKLLFVQFDDLDHAAHKHGGYSDEYYEKVKKMDDRLGRIYDTIESKGLMENSLFIVVADHGENENGHGGNSADERSAVFAVAGRTVNKKVLGSGVHNRDVAAVALYALGIEQPAHFDSKVPAGLFGTAADKTVAPGNAPLYEKFLYVFLYTFVRGVNLLCNPFDAR